MQNKSYWQAVERIVEIIAEELPELKEPIECILAGGSAVHYYVSERVSHDVDIEFSKRILLPGDVVVSWTDDNGKVERLSLDRNYTSALGLMHPDYISDAVDVGHFEGKLILKVLSPVDLVVSKIARFQDNDQSDIAMLARFGFIDENEFRVRAEEAMVYYIFPENFIRANIEKACQIIKENSPTKPR
jgi:hypothetical protein